MPERKRSEVRSRSGFSWRTAADSVKSEKEKEVIHLRNGSMYLECFVGGSEVMDIDLTKMISINLGRFLQLDLWRWF